MSSTTITFCVALAVLPAASVAVHVTGVVPTAKALPDGERVIVTAPVAPDVVGVPSAPFGRVAPQVVAPAPVNVITSAGAVMLSGGFTTWLSGVAALSATGTATDNAGNSTSVTVSGIKIDKTKPVITYTGNAGAYTVDQTVVITCHATDALSGLASDTCTGVNAPAYTLASGSHTLTATATDIAGNAANGSTTFTIGTTPSDEESLRARLKNRPLLCEVLAGR